jgi:hypothetical protein
LRNLRRHFPLKALRAGARLTNCVCNALLVSTLRLAPMASHGFTHGFQNSESEAN